MSELANQMLNVIKKPLERSKQKLVGASSIGGCPRCLGYKLMNEPNPNEFRLSSSGMAAWIGTAVHYFLEHHYIDLLDGFVRAETRVDIFELEGYGVIRGNIDLHSKTEVVDFKVVGDWSYNNMALEFMDNPDTIPNIQYRVQQMLYAYGLRKQGFDIEQVSLLVFKKTSNSFNDVSIYTELYNQELVDAAFENLVEIYKLSKEGKFEELPESENCYVCSRGW